ncbi:hypothetical protein [Cellulomonas sp. NPDC058312]|jgi:hypothetical protein|uniref:hypothetical protein n=1 Tax=Cellulomonas sp. NPDC058312 TaxID=3346441 RepID=UPI0036F183B5
MTQDPTDRPTGVLPDGDPDDTAEQSTPGSEGDGPESGYVAPTDEETSPGTTHPDGR